MGINVIADVDVGASICRAKFESNDNESNAVAIGVEVFVL
jgi:hypothetical protein